MKLCRFDSCHRFAAPHCQAYQVARSSSLPRLRCRSGIQEAAKADLGSGVYFVATNNFKVKTEHALEFEDIWKSRESHLNESPGFIRFALLRGDEAGEYISQTHWQSRDHFDQWRNSQQFQKAHAGVSKEGQTQERSGGRPGMSELLEGRPTPKFYQAVTVTESSTF